MSDKESMGSPNQSFTNLDQIGSEDIDEMKDIEAELINQHEPNDEMNIDDDLGLGDFKSSDDQLGQDIDQDVVTAHDKPEDVEKPEPEPEQMDVESANLENNIVDKTAETEKQNLEDSNVDANVETEVPVKQEAEEPKPKTEPEDSESEKPGPEKVEPEKVEPEKVEPEKIEPEKVEPEKSRSVAPEEKEEPEYEPEIDEEKARFYRQTHTIIVPSYSSWFNMKKVHQIEKKSLPEFFEVNHPSKSPKIYVSYRNFMINAYRLNPNEYLTLTSCRRNLVGDVGTLMRVFKFLNKWGLINYQVNPSFKPAYNLERLGDGSVAPLPYSGDYKVTYDSPRGLFPFETFKLNSEINIQKLKDLMGDSVKPMKNITNSDSQFVNENNKRSIESDDTPNKKLKDSWTEDELKKLLKAIKSYKNDWFNISKSVGSKTPQECILKFLKLPIEDNFSSLSETDLNLLKYSSNFPASSIDNPVINNLIFMTQLVDSDVAKAASERASKVMHEKILEKIEQTEQLEKAKKSKDIKQENKDEVKPNSGNEFEDMIIEPNDDEDGDKEQGESNEDSATKVSNGDSESLKESLKDLETSSSSPTENAKEINATLFGMVGAKSHLFKTYEEREMNKLTSTILNQEMNKINVKLERISKLEKIYETQQKILVKQQEDVFLDRLNLTNSTISITKKLNNLISNLEQSNGESKIDSEDLISKLSEIKSMIYDPLRSTLVEDDKNTTTKPEEKSENFNDPSMNPLSLQSPQTFKVWVP